MTEPRWPSSLTTAVVSAGVVMVNGQPSISTICPSVMSSETCSPAQPAARSDSASKLLRILLGTTKHDRGGGEQRQVARQRPRGHRAGVAAEAAAVDVDAGVHHVADG